MNRNTTMKTPNRTSRGFSLIELMISILIGMIVMLGVMTIFGQTLRNNRDILGSARLNQDLGTVATIMANDIRRAGYSGGSLPAFGGGDPANWHNARNADLNIIMDANGTPSCILYSYNLDMDNPDSNNDGQVNAADANPIDDDERFGFRLNTADGSISMRRECTPGNPLDPADDCYDTCTAGTWEQVTDPTVVNITQLSFTTVGSRCMVDGELHYWTIRDTGTAGVFTDDPITFPCDNDTTQIGAPTLTQLTDVDVRLLNGTTGVYAAAPPWSSTITGWSDLELQIPRTQAWAAANPQVDGTPATYWDSAVETRQISIDIVGALATDPAVAKEIHTQVKVGNNRVFVAPPPP